MSAFSPTPHLPETSVSLGDERQAWAFTITTN